MTAANPKARAKKVKAAPSSKPASNVLEIDSRYLIEGEIERMKGASGAEVEAFGERLTARALAQPEVRAARVIQNFEGDQLNINAAADELRKQVADVKRGDMARGEGMLVTQAHTLDALFSTLAMRSKMNSDGGFLDAADRYLRLAFKAQAQCRATIEALAEIKNPRPVAFVKQANIAHGHQQVNNVAHADDIPARGENMIPSNELSGAGYELLPDARASQTASRIDTPLEALGKIHGAANRRGEKHQRRQ